jgi:hypothetical protein
MTKYTHYSRRPEMAERPWKVHPIWRGIGCIMAIIIPIMSYASAVLLVQQNQQQGWLPLPRELAGTIYLPILGNVPYLYANLIVTLVLMLIGYGILTTMYALLYKVIGPPSLGPLDAPPVRHTPGKRR